MKPFTCRLCYQRICDETWCDNCKDDQFKANGITGMTPEKEAEVDNFVKDLITKAKANGYPKGKVS